MDSLNKKEEYESFFAQEKVPINAKINKNSNFKIYALKETGQIICEFNLKLGLENKKIEIAQITDVHLNYCFDDAFEDDEVNYTKHCRTWLANGEATTSLNKALDVALYFDQTVITGDILDYLSNGAMYLVQKHIFERQSEVICTIGSHDITKQMQTGLENKLSEEKRFEIIQDFWPHDIYYVSKVINDKIIVIGLNTAMSRYYPSQIRKLQDDIKIARDEGKYILIFQHNPISTGNPLDTQVEPILLAGRSGPEVRNFYSGCMGNIDGMDETTKEMCEIITHSGDVIKGLFCGHYHSLFYTEIMAFDKNGKETVIPQIVSMGTPYFDGVGILTRIIVE